MSAHALFLIHAISGCKSSVVRLYVTNRMQHIEILQHAEGHNIGSWNSTLHILVQLRKRHYITQEWNQERVRATARYLILKQCATHQWMKEIKLCRQPAWFIWNREYVTHSSQQRALSTRDWFPIASLSRWGVKKRARKERGGMEIKRRRNKQNTTREVSNYLVQRWTK